MAGESAMREYRVKDISPIARLFRAVREVTGAAMIPGLKQGNEIKKGEALDLRLCHIPEQPADIDEGNACSM